MKKVRNRPSVNVIQRHSKAGLLLDSVGDMAPTSPSPDLRKVCVCVFCVKGDSARVTVKGLEVEELSGLCVWSPRALKSEERVGATQHTQATDRAEEGHRSCPPSPRAPERSR